jgi:hypothetical protein
MTCDAKVLFVASWYDSEGRARIAQCEELHSHPDVDVHHGRITDPFTIFDGEWNAPEITWLESDRRTFRGDLVMCPALVPAKVFPKACTLPGGHRGRHAP